jgi:hypothetical protein
MKYYLTFATILLIILSAKGNNLVFHKMQIHEGSYYYYGCLSEEDKCVKRVAMVLKLVVDLKGSREFKIYFAKDTLVEWKINFLGEEISITNFDNADEFDFKVFKSYLCRPSFNECFYKVKPGSYDLYNIRHQTKNELVSKVLFDLHKLLTEERNSFFLSLMNENNFALHRMTFETFQDLYCSLLFNNTPVAQNLTHKMEEFFFELVHSPDTFFKDFYKEIAKNHFSKLLLKLKVETDMEAIIGRLSIFRKKAQDPLKNISNCHGKLGLEHCIRSELPDLVKLISSELNDFKNQPVVSNADRQSNPLTEYFKMVLYNHEMQKSIYADRNGQKSEFNPLMITVESFINQFFQHDKFKNSLELSY